MKSLKVLAVATLMSLSLPAMAQFSNVPAGNNENKTKTTPSEISDYNRFDMGYDAFITTPDEGEGAAASGFRVRYTHGFSLTKNIPLFFELGLGLNANFKGEEEDGFSTKAKYMTLSVPLNIAGRFGSDKFGFSPYTGFSLNVNVLGNVTSEYGDNSSETNLFDEDQLGEELAWKRFQLGWQIGAAFDFGGSALIGIEYGLNVIKLSEYVRNSHVSVVLGFMF